MIELSRYVFETLREDRELALCRGQRDGELPNILLVAPVSEHPVPGILERLEHEYSLKQELDPRWAARPMAIARHWDRTVLVSEDPGGVPLDQLLGEPLDLAFWLRLAIGLSSAIDQLHQRGIIHKDIKPANVLANSVTGQCWLMGFGIASRVPRERQPSEPPAVMAGTLAYMAPEQTGRMNRSIDSRSDLYSLGVTLYEMLTGVLPFIASDPMEWVHCHIARQPAPLSERRNEIPEPISALILKLLAKTAEERYQTAAGVEADLRKCLAQWESGERIEPFPLGVHDIPDQLLIPEKLYGRNAECQMLLAAFDRVVASGTPELVLMSGYSGIGKSSVVNELHKAIVLPRGIFILGKFGQHKREIPYATLAQAFQGLVRQILSKSEEEVIHWRNAILEALGFNGQLIVNVIPELELIIGKQPPVPEIAPDKAQNRFDAVLRQFLGAFARKECPLALFVDDLQWLDPASLKLLEQFITHPDIRYLLLIGAYRDNEVTAHHPLMPALEAIRKSGAIVHEIVLKPLSLADVTQLVGDALRCEPAVAYPLAELVHEKTGGNPFFTIQFLTTLAEERLLVFEAREAAWRWDARRIRAKGFTDNVVELMTGKLKRLPANTQKTIKQFACLGNRAETKVLSMVHGGSEEEVQMDLWEAVRAGLVLRLGSSYKFLHDRVHEAAYALIPEALCPQMHHRIARLLIAKMTRDEIAEEIFDVVHQLNSGLAVISDPDEKEQAAELNLSAGRKAKASTAYASACTYLSAGMDLIGYNAWERRYELAFGLWLERAECEYLIGDFDKADRLIAELLSRAVSKVDKAAAYRLKVLVHILRAEYWQAVDTGLDCLRLLGIEIPVNPTRDQVRTEYETIWQNLGERSIESLIDLSPMTDPEIRAAMEILSEIRAPANYTGINLHYFATCRMVNLSVSYGTTDASTHGYAGLATILGPVFNRYLDGYLFGKLACSLVEKYGFNAYRAKAFLIMEVVSLWTQPISKGTELARLAFRAGVETGDLSFACYSCNHIITDMLAQGVHLDEVWSESQKRLEFDRKIKFRDAADMVVSQQRLIQNLRGQTTTFSTFSDAEFDEEAYETALTEDRMTSMICAYWILKLEARFMSGDYDLAILAAQRAKALLWSVEIHFQTVNYYYYYALAAAAVHEQECNTPTLQQSSTPSPLRSRRSRSFPLVLARSSSSEVVRQALERFGQWSESCPETFLDKYTLISAELARMENRDLEAMRLYEEAIRLARENGFVQNEALSNELAARFYAARGFEKIAHAYLRDARYYYLRWGAGGKVRQLDELYPYLREEEPIPGRTSTIGAMVEHLDLATIIKVSQAVSGEIVLEKLIDTLMRTAIEHAGAERGLLILPRGVEQWIAAEVRTGRDGVEVQLRQALVTPSELPESLFRYVVRTLESVILDDASVQNQFSEDEYLRQSRSRSVLCLALVKQAKLIGVLYLENNLAPRVFTSKRLEMLELLASQAAISLDHARVYAELSRENSDRRKAEEALRASEQRLQDIIDNTPAVVTVKDLDLHYLLINREHERRFQVQRDQIRGKTDYDFLPRDVAEKIRANDRQVIEAGSPIQFEVTTPMTEGERHYVVVKFLLRDGTGKPYAVCGISTDITGRKQAEEARRKAQAELAHVTRVATLGELAGSIAHEVKQPLTAIINNADACLALLPGEISKLEDVREALSDIISDADRASAVIERIRGLIKKSPPQKARLDLNETIGGVIALARGELNSNGVLLRTKLANDLPLIMGDRIHLQQVILNLVINGIEAMRGVTNAPRELWISSEKVGAAPDLVDAGQETRNPQLSTRSVLRSLGEKGNSGQAYILVSVADSGPGLDPNILSRLFDAFYTTKPEGLGMGLTISRSIVEAFGGRLWATANVPKGALFQFTLPVAND